MIPSEPSAPRPTSGAPETSPPKAERELRLFIAIPLPGRVRAELERLSSDLQKAFQFTKCEPSWASPETFHLTLRFLGDTPESKIESLASDLRSAIAKREPPQLRAYGLDVFPDFQRPKVLWTGMMERTDGLEPLQHEIERIAVSQGFDPERNDYLPHLTLARFRRARGTNVVRGIVQSHQGFRGSPFTAAEVILYQSHLGRSGVSHEPLQRFAFSPGK